MAKTGNLPRWLPTANKFVRFMNKMGLQLGPVQVLTIQGRKSGQMRATPVTPLHLAGSRYIIAAVPNGDWALNALAAGIGTLAQGRKMETVRLEEINDLDLKRTVLSEVPVQSRPGVPFYVQLGLVTKADSQQFAAIADKVRVFRLKTV